MTGVQTCALPIFRPIATPVMSRRVKGLGKTWCNGDAGCSRTAVATQAEIMNKASSADSIRYSGQCVLSASAADRCFCFAGTNSLATGEETIVGVAGFAMEVSVMRDGIPKAAGSDRNTQRNSEAQRLN